MAAKYGYDLSGPATSAREAVQWLYFGYLGCVKEQNGAAMSLGRVSTFLDVYLERDLEAGLLTEEQAQELIDDFVIKLRIVRFLRTPEYDELFSAIPTWVTESIAGMGDDGRPLVTKTSFRILHTLYNLGPAPEPNLTVWYTPQLPEAVPPLLGQGRDRHQLDPVRKRRDHARGVGRRRGDRLLRLADGARQADAVLRRARQPRQEPALRDQRRPRREERRPGRAAVGPGRRRLSRFRRRARAYEAMMDWLAGTYVSAMNAIHYMHDKYAYERLEMALHDYNPLRTMAFGIAGMSVVADSLRRSSTPG
jgi:formate C-acetyltransferase